MTYHHVIARVGDEAKSRVLFEDLSAKDLRKHFLKPYWKGKQFYSGSDLISPGDLRSLKIIQTNRTGDEERSEINRKDLRSIDRHNRSSPGVVFISVGRGFDPDDIAGIGFDVTAKLTKGPPGGRVGLFGVPWAVVGWGGGILGAVIAGGILKWLGWL